MAWEDGTIYVYELDMNYDPKEDFKDAIVQIKSNNGGRKDDSNFATKADLVLRMQKLVEDFDFQQKYGSGSQNSSGKKELLVYN